MNTRLFGTLGMLGAPMLLLESLSFGFERHESNQLVGLLSLIYVVGWMCTVAGLRTLKAAGERVPGKVFLVVQLIGLVLAGLWAIIHIALLPHLSLDRLAGAQRRPARADHLALPPGRSAQRSATNYCRCGDPDERTARNRHRYQ